MAAGLAGYSADKALILLPRILLATLFFFANNLRAEDVLLTVNVKKPVALTSDKFLSYTLDPTVVLTGNALTKNLERSVNMAKALAPAYVRIGGPRSNSYTFERPHRQQVEQDPGFTFTERDWIVMHRWAENAGLDVLACIAPQHSESGGRDPGWDSRNALDLISFSDHMGFNTSWQLGYECQTRCDVSGIDIGRDVMRLRSMLDAFPRYSKSVITGPDVVTYRTKQQQQYLQDYLNVAGTALSAVTWHPDFASVTLDPEGVSLHHDNLALDRDGLYRIVGRLISKKPLWLAESKPEECKKNFLGAIVWIRRLGNAARVGAQVLMRQPMDSNLIQPTPDYWVSVLHKSLVGREVLDTKIATGNRTHVHFYCQCTKPSSKYEKGSLTIFGINLTPYKVNVNLKGVKIKTLHKYILLPGFDAENRMFSETVLLNNEPLNLLNGKEVPEIKPTISSNSKGVALKLPSGGIGFWVIPGLKIKSCGGPEEDNTEKMFLKKLTRRLEEAESDEDSAHEVDQEEDDSEENISAEERRYSSKTNKTRKRRKHRYSEEDDAEKRYRKLEARMDLERLEKLLRRRDSYDDRKMPRSRTAHFGFEEKSQEKVDLVDEETGEEIRAKLEEYKHRLEEYENRKRLTLKSRGKITDIQDQEIIDNDKVVEAMTLISKMEKTMKSLEKNDDGSPTETLDPSGSYDVTSGLDNPSKSENPEDMFLDELLKSEKIKRDSMPSNIEDQLRAIYQMLAEEKLRRQRNLLEVSKFESEREELDNPLQEVAETLSRTRRDTEKKFGEDPLGLRKEGLFRRRTKNDDARERRIDRRRRKDKDDRKDGQPVIFDPRAVSDSNENNFYGFQQRQPLKGFPEGDVFLTTGTSSEENTKDYDYVRDDDDGPEQGRPKKQTRITEKQSKNPEPDDVTWIEEENTELSHVPKEFFEDVKMAAPRVHEKLKGYGELWEAESLGEEKYSQDHFNPGDEEATVDKIVQEHRPDAREDKRVKETAVRKLIGYYDNPKSHQDEEDEEIDYIDTQGLGKTRHPLRDSPRNSVSTSEIRNQRPMQHFQRNPDSATNKKRIKDLTSGEFRTFTDYDSVHLSQSAISSAELEAFSIYEPASRPAQRSKRSTNDLEDIMNEEMIFQDDNNLKDCACRVNRGTKLSRRRGDRQKRRRRPDRRYNENRAERTRSKNCEKPPTTKPGGRFDEDYMHSTRKKREAEPLSEEFEEEIEADFSNESDALSEEDESTQISSETSEGEIDSDAEDVAAILIEPVVEEVKDSIAEQEIKSLDLEEDKRMMPDKNDHDEEQKLMVTKDPKGEFTDAVNDSGLMIQNDEQDLGIDKIVKRHNEEQTKSLVDVGEAIVEKDQSVSEEPINVLAKSSEANQFFLEPQSENLETSSKKVDENTEKDITRHTLRVVESGENLYSSSSEDKQSTVQLRSVGTETKVEDSSCSTTSSTNEGVQDENGSIKSRHGEDSTIKAIEDLIEDSHALSLNNEAEKEGEDSRTISSTANHVTKIPKSPKEPKNNTRMPTKTAQKTKQGIKVVDPAKAREARLTARTDALQALKQENDSKKAKKSLENVSKKLSDEQAKFQAMQKKRTEKLEKLREKLRLKREKIVQEYRNKLMGELDKAGDNKERNLKRREIIDMIYNDEKLLDIVDQEKLHYLMQNKPINYEDVPEEYPLKGLEQRKKYVPEIIDMVRPRHAVRERKVKGRDQPAKHSNDPEILKFVAPEESSNFEAIRKTLREGIDVNDHKVEGRPGKSYYAIVESLENPKIHGYSSEDELQDEESAEVFQSDDSKEPLKSNTQKAKSFSHEYSEAEEEDRHRSYNRRRRIISDSQEDMQQMPKSANYSPRCARNASNKNKYMCLKEDSNEASLEDQDKLFKLVKENDHYMAMPIKDGKSKNKEEYVSKKRYLKDEDYEQNSKYKSPKYERLAPEKIETSRRGQSQSNTKNDEAYEAKTVRQFDSEDVLQEIASKNSRNKKMKEFNAEDELYDERKRDLAQLKSDLEVIDDLDLDEALNSSKYELLMLIPVRNQMRSRQRRQVENKLFRDQENSASNEISMDISDPSIKDKSEKSFVEATTVTVIDNSEDLTTLQYSTDKKNADGLISQVSDIFIVKTSNPSTKEEEKILEKYAIEEIVNSVPKIVGDKTSITDQEIPALIEVFIPRLEAKVTGGLDKARTISESFEKFIDGFDDRFNRKLIELEDKNPESIQATNMQNDTPITSDIFGTTTINVKKFFDFLTGMIHIFQID